MTPPLRDEGRPEDAHKTERAEDVARRLARENVALAQEVQRLTLDRFGARLAVLLLAIVLVGQLFWMPQYGC